MGIKIEKVSYEATIPTSQFANIKPRIEFDTDDLEGASELAVQHFIKLSQKYGENGATITPNDVKK